MSLALQWNDKGSRCNGESRVETSYPARPYLKLITGKPEVIKMSETKNSFIFYRSFYEAFAPLNDTQKAQLFTAICEGALNQKETEMEPLVLAMFTLIKPQLIANQTRYENGKKGGRPKTESKPKRNRKQTKAKPNVNVNVNENDIKNKQKDFEQAFWPAYPMRKSKKKALEAFLKTTAPLEEILEGLKRYKKELTEKETKPSFIAHASTWLNQERWKDEYLPNKNTSADGLSWKERNALRNKAAGLS